MPQEKLDAQGGHGRLLERRNANCRVDAELVKQANAERDYWHAVLERVTETIHFLSECG